jgi:hypothetical protein
MKRTTIFLSCCFGLLLHTSTALTHNEMPLPANSTASPAPLLLPDHGGKIETKYNGFDHEMVVTLQKMRVTCGAAKGMQSALKDTCVSLLASLHCPGKQLDYVRQVRLQLIFETKDWTKRHALDERDLIVVADGERLTLGTMKLVNQDVNTSQLVDVMKEVLEVSLPYQTFQKIARAQVVEMKVGKTMFELGENNIAALRDLNNRVKP